MIARSWHGRVPRTKAAVYEDYLRRTGLADYARVAGNRGVYLLRRDEGDITHFTTLTFWDSVDAIRAFAGDDYERARYYPEDDNFLLEREPHVTHYTVVESITADTPMHAIDIDDLGTQYAAAWSSQNPSALVAFYADTCSLSVNGGPPAVGRAAVTQAVQAFMTAFPDMNVKMTRMERRGDQTIFHWLWTGTNSGPGGTGKFVRIEGYEAWRLDADGNITESKGHYDVGEYQRQLQVGAPK